MSLIYLNTKNTSYILNITAYGKLEHIYYGKRIKEVKEANYLKEPQNIETPHSVLYNKNLNRETLDTMSLEYGEIGKGDFREPAISIYGNVGYVSDFVYMSHRFYEGKENHETLPSAKSNNKKCTTLEVVLFDKSNNVELILYYHSFYEVDVITRYVKVINKSEESIKLNRVMSLQLDFDNEGYTLTSFEGEWTREMQIKNQPIISGIYTIDSKVGTSSNRHNPFVILKQNDCKEMYGDCYGFNLIYSGNHSEIIEVNCYDKIRVLTGINPHCFEYTLEKGEDFISPEAVMTFSPKGLNGLSNQMHKFVREHIISPNFKEKERPVLLNNWEATYFDFNKEILLNLANQAKEVGIELFVLDDGWFGERKDDTSALGDWMVNEEKLGGPLNELVKSIKDLGLEFGIWVEPEMISENSELYRNHPEWVLGKKGENLCEGRNQYVLDLTRKEVCDYLVETLTKLLNSADITYVKWDMNRNFSDVYSEFIHPSRQGEVFHKYMIGFYDVVKRLTEGFPNILFEGCAAGGNRFDLGMLCYMPQIWASDNTDASERVGIQRGLSYGYPQSTYGAHVSCCPNHQTGRNTSIETRFNIASMGVLGYELNLLELSEVEKETIKKQIAYYKKNRKLLQFGEMYRLESGENKVITAIVSENKKQAIISYYQYLQKPNPNKEKLKAYILDDEVYYHIESREQRIQENDFLPHSKQYMGEIMPKEIFDLWGDHFNYAGICLGEQIIGNNFNAGRGIVGDFGSRLYYICEKQ